MNKNMNTYEQKVEQGKKIAIMTKIYLWGGQRYCGWKTLFLY